MNTQIIRQLLLEVGTPSYIYDIDEFDKRVRLVKKEFGKEVGLCFSMKANPFLLENLPDIFEKIEVCSPGELSICEKTGVDTSKIIFSGVNKTAEDIERAMDDQVGIFTVESYLHAKLIDQSAAKRGIKVPVLIRVADGSQFGIDEEDVISLVRHREEYHGLDIVGLHYFTGTQKRKTDVIEKELKYISGFADRIKTETGFRIKKIEYGTGLAVDYFKDTAEELEEARLKAIASKVREIAQKYDLTIEMGRFFAAPCGYYLTRVMDTKTNCGVHYAICDGGLNHLKYDGQIQGMQIPEILHIKRENRCEKNVEKWTLCGSLCTTMDILSRNAEFDSLQIGDVLVFCRTGAYSAMEGMALFLSREMPLISLYSERGGLRILRRIIHTDSFHAL